MLFDFDLFWVRFTGVVAIQHNFLGSACFAMSHYNFFFQEHILY